jgi:hypothetical protein
MIKSKFISDILELILDGDDIGDARNQMEYLTEKDYEYTGVGLFVNFSHSDGIDKFKANNENLIIGGLVIKSKELEIGASVTMFFTDGVNG